MSTKSEYLQKYLGIKVKKKKLRKRSKATAPQPRIHIIDDDINITAIHQDPLLESEEELGEDAPQIADIDEVIPKTGKMHEAKWKTIDNATETIHRKRLDSDSDLSPPRHHKSEADQISLNQYKQSPDRNKSDSDLSPPRSNSNYNDLPKEMLTNDIVMLSKDGSNSNRKATKSEKKYAEKPNKILGKQEKAIAVIQKIESKKHEHDIDMPLHRKEDTSKSETNPNSSLDENKDLCIPEIFRPLARYKDDPELDEYLKKQERGGDTMLAYIHSKQKKKEPNNQNVPMYKGPPPPPNRFNMKPGYRWDGVDRSNGFEKQYFDLQAKKKSQADLAYKWSVENM